MTRHGHRGGNARTQGYRPKAAAGAAEELAELARQLGAGSSGRFLAGAAAVAAVGTAGVYLHDVSHTLHAIERHTRPDGTAPHEADGARVGQAEHRGRVAETNAARQRHG